MTEPSCNADVLSDLTIKLRAEADAARFAAEAVQKYLEIRNRGDVFIPFPFAEPAVNSPVIDAAPVEERLVEGPDGKKVYNTTGKRISRAGMERIIAGRRARAEREKQERQSGRKVLSMRRKAKRNASGQFTKAA